ncbi:MAG: PIG-L family deacetylase [Cytophaga sp.]|uniref:PIG-L family deacetylase n=1 Tax=Cytophaga sp. TaxID=29535 RepID=UPI003F7D353A
MKRILILFLAVLFRCSYLQAQSTAVSSADILQKLHKLNTVGSVLYIAAHPDDENTRLLPYLTYERKLRTGYLSLTRGDGGQNLIGKEQGEPLGLIRTEELLAARHIDGAEQFFTRANDFGFSKNPDETFGFWNKDSILADVVWVIRNFKPDVIITRFPTTGEGGHGHHTASAILAIEAFTAAADPKRFPEQLKYTEVWQAKRIFWNTFSFGTINTTSESQIKIDIGGYNPLLGKSYGELASENRSMHKSQGFGTAKTRGQTIEYFKQLGGDSVSKDIFENINISWNRFPAAAKLSKSLDKIIAKYNAQQPQLIVTDLVAFYKQLQALNETDATLRSWKKYALKETEELLLASSGLWMEAYAADYIAIPGNDIATTVQIINRNKNLVTVNAIRYINQDTACTLTLKPNELYTLKHADKLPKEFSYSNPYWLNQKHSPGLYTVSNPLLIGKPKNDPAATVVFTVTIEGLQLSVTRPVVYRYTDPVKGEIYRPLEILPAAMINIAERVYVFNDTLPKNISFVVKANMANVSGTLDWQLPEDWRATSANNSFKLNAKGDEALITISIQPSASSLSGKISAFINVNGERFSKGITRIEYDHIPYQFILTDAEATIVHMDLRTAGKNIGYIPGAGDDVVACLKQVGYNVTILTDDLLDKGDLKQYNAIVTGIRAYNTNDRLQIYYKTLMQYVEQGGNLVVQYNTNNRIGPLLAKIGPYPFTISRDRVTDEQAEVRILQPAHVVFQYPNKINSTDFNGWIQERGIYFATEADTHYQSMLSLNDPNEKPHEGSLIVTPYGKGNFVYTGLVFFRELPAGVPGAYRLFINLLSIPENK